jgi:hypothetical protein
MNLQNSNTQETRKRNFSTFFFQIFVYFCRFWKNLFFCKISVLKNAQKKSIFLKQKILSEYSKILKKKVEKLQNLLFLTFLNVLHLYKRFLDPKNSKKFRYFLQFLFPTLIGRGFYNSDFYFRYLTYPAGAFDRVRDGRSCPKTFHTFIITRNKRVEYRFKTRLTALETL